MQNILLTGKVFSGMHIANIFIQKLNNISDVERKGAHLYLGTLNLRLPEPFTFPATAQKITQDVSGFKGDIFLLPVLIQENISGFIVRSTVTTYDDTIVEIVSETPLRDTLTLKDGDTVSLTLL